MAVLLRQPHALFGVNRLQLLFRAKMERHPPRESLGGLRGLSRRALGLRASGLCALSLCALGSCGDGRLARPPCGLRSLRNHLHVAGQNGARELIPRSRQK